MAEERLKMAIAREEKDLAKMEEEIASSKDRGWKLHVRACQRDIRARITALRYALNVLQGERKEE